MVLLVAMAMATPLAAQTTVPQVAPLQNLQPEIAGLQGPFDLVADATGRDVYVSGFLEDSVVHFRRDAQSGALDWYGSSIDGQGGVIGLDGPEQLALSPDGSTLYAAAHHGDGLVTFDRDANTGELSWRSVYSDPTALNGAATVAVSSSGERIYLGTFSAGTLQVFQQAPGVAPQPLYFAVDPVLEGALSIIAVDAPPFGTLLYVAGTATHTISVWLDNGTQLLRMQTVTDGSGGVDGLLGVNDLELSADGQHLYASSFGDAAVTHFTRDAGGLLVYAESYALLEFDQLARVELSPDEALLYTSSSGNDEVFSLERDLATGALSWPALPRRGGGVGTFPGLDNPYGLLAVGGHVYTTALLADAVRWFEEFPPRSFVPFAFPIGGQTQAVREIGSGNLADVRGYLARVRELEAGGVAGFSHFRRFFGAQGSPEGGVISLLSDARTGQLFPEWVLPATEPGAATVLASADGAFLYVGYNDDVGSGRIQVWSLGLAGAEPSLVQTFGAIRGSLTDGVRAMAFGPNGRLYFIAPNGALVVYLRDAATGMLTYQTSRSPGLWDELVDLAVTPSGDAIFASARNTDGIVRWSLDALGDPTGAVQYLANDTAPRELEVSDDGSRLLFTTEVPWRLHNAPIIGGGLGTRQTVVAAGLPSQLSVGPDRRVYLALHQREAVGVWQLGSNGMLSALGEITAERCAPMSQDDCLRHASAVTVGSDGKTILLAGAGVAVGPPSGGLVAVRDEHALFSDDFESGNYYRWSGLGGTGILD